MYLGTRQRRGDLAGAHLAAAAAGEGREPNTFEINISIFCQHCAVAIWCEKLVDIFRCRLLLPGLLAGWLGADFMGM